VAADLEAEIAAWTAASRRFRSFVDTHRDKIRKKIRAAPDANAVRDVRTELLVAFLLLADRRIVLGYESYGSGRAGPDFTVTFRETQRLNVEVTRLRRAPDPPAVAGVLLGKLRQLPPSVANVLITAVDGAVSEEAVAEAVAWLRAHADAKHEPFFTERGFAGSRGFYDRFLRLGAMVLWSDTAPTGERTAAWVNRSARIAVPDRALRAIVDALGAGT
jgi:hypothetical protein